MARPAVSVRGRERRLIRGGVTSDVVREREVDRGEDSVRERVKGTVGGKIEKKLKKNEGDR